MIISFLGNVKCLIDINIHTKNIAIICVNTNHELSKTECYLKGLQEELQNERVASISLSQPRVTSYSPFS